MAANLRTWLQPWDSQPQEAAEIDLLAAAVYAINLAQARPSTALALPGCKIASQTIAPDAVFQPTKNGSKFGSIAGVVGDSATSTRFELPRSELNAAFSASGQASIVMVCQSAGAGGHASGVTPVCTLQAGGSFNHYPFTDGNIYIGPLSSTRYLNGSVSGATAGIYAPHVLIATHRSGAQACYVNGKVIGSGTAAETPTLGAAAGIGQFGAAYFLAAFDRELTAREIASFSEKPWQLFAPRRITVPVSVAGAGDTAAITAAAGAATASSLAGAATAAAAITQAAGAATASTVGGASTAASAITSAAGAATASTLPGAAAAASTITAAAGAATASTVAAASTAAASITQAAGTSTAGTLTGVAGSGSTITAAAGSATASTLAGSSAAASAITAASGAATASTAAGASTAAATITAAAGAATAATLTGSTAGDASAITPAAGASSAQIIVGASFAQAAMTAAAGSSTASTMAPVGSFVEGNPRVWLVDARSHYTAIDARNRVAHLS